ncbi:hypothetical protein HAP47_0022360 [Bradyrhizobium sp. 41S5]|uniref:hypothetical protein n=1 Tax=Bradyrhizobium sp. 41S5 TaxID=1404443 RepID=UPI00156B6899|nr:hypothetical protein [Bradyrhizobium sp. 41S5]UFX42024.1 hypothetical protein HAP47_0022360 [Bradyrhizobium sp. 41S5]
MAKPTEVFTPNDVPTFTYVQRPVHKLEDRLREAFEVPKMIVSISGPSKSGKTVLVSKIIEPDNLIPLTGSTIRSADELWSNVLQWMDAPHSKSEKVGSTTKFGVEAVAEGKAGVPFLAEAKAGGKASVGHDRTADVTRNYKSDGLQQVIKEIAHSSFVVFVDDFHYIPKEVQEEIGRQIKAAAEAGIRICTASVPHRRDDVVRSNPELRGRVTGIDSGYWSDDELSQIAYLGFRELNVDLSPNVVRQLVAEAFGSPQLMQAICLNFCFENAIRDALPDQVRIDPDFVTMQQVFERTSTLTNFSSMLSQLHSGPRQRGMDRKVYLFNDGSKGDVYRCVLLAMKADPPQLAFKYDDLLKRTAAVCLEDRPSGSSVSQALEQMDKLAKLVQEATVIEWDEDVLDIIEPYFLFFLRSSTHLKSIA